MPDITPGYTFTSGETNITHSKLNQATAGSIANTFHTGKGSIGSNPDKTTTEVMVYDTATTTLKKSTLSNLIFDNTELINERTAKTTPVGTEELLINDGGTHKKITHVNLLNGAAEFTGTVAYNDTLPFYDTSGTAIGKIQAGNLIYNLGARAGALVATDELPVVNTGGTTAEKITVNQLFTAPNVLTAKTTPRDDDKIAIYDVAGTAAKGSTLKSFGPVHRGSDAGANDAYAVTCTPTVNALYTGLTVVFKANTANTGACTLAVDGLAATTIKKFVNQDLVTNDIKAAQWVKVVYDGTNFQAIGIDQTLVSTDFTIPGSAGKTIDITHGLGIVPRYVRWVLVAQATPGDGYTEGDELDANTAIYVPSAGINRPVFNQLSNTTHLYLINNAAETSIFIPSFTTPGNTWVALGASKWKARCYYAP